MKKRRKHGFSVSLGNLGLGILDRVSRYPLADRAGSLRRQPLLFVSSGRSGTTLLRSMLVTGGQIAIPPESYKIPDSVRKFAVYQLRGWRFASHKIVRLFEAHPWFEIWQTDLKDVYRSVDALASDERSLARVIDEVFQAYLAQHFPDALLWGDQTPLNALYLPWIYRTFPQAKYLHLVRDGRDVIASMIEKGIPLARATDRWLISVAAAAALKRRLGSSQFHEISYERLVSEPVKALEEVCKFTGIDYTPRMLQYWESPTTVEHRHFQHLENVGKPLFTASIGRWKTRLSQEQQDHVASKAGAMLRRYGYATGAAPHTD